MVVYISCILCGRVWLLSNPGVVKLATRISGSRIRGVTYFQVTASVYDTLGRWIEGWKQKNKKQKQALRIQLNNANDSKVDQQKKSADEKEHSILPRFWGISSISQTANGFSRSWNLKIALHVVKIVNAFISRAEIRRANCCMSRREAKRKSIFINRSKLLMFARFIS